MDDMFRVSGTNLTVFVPKELDHHIAEMLNQKTDWIMEQKNIRRIVFDFRETDFMDSSGIGVIMGRYRNINLIGGKVEAVHVNDRIDKLLHMSGIYKLISISRREKWNIKGNQKGNSMENTNEMSIEFDSRSCNEGFARVAVAAFCTQLNPTLEGGRRCKNGGIGGNHKFNHSWIRG